MERCAVLLRGINVGRSARLRMADLREVLTGLGCQDVVTHLQSGNALVTAEVDGLAERVAAALPLQVGVVVFRREELLAAVEQCPFRERAAREPKQVFVVYADRLPSQDALAALGPFGDDVLAVGPRVLYLSLAGPSNESPLAKAVARARLGVVLTARNWNTATRLVELSA